MILSDCWFLNKLIYFCSLSFENILTPFRGILTVPNSHELKLRVDVLPALLEKRDSCLAIGHRVVKKLLLELCGENTASHWEEASRHSRSCTAFLQALHASSTRAPDTLGIRLSAPKALREFAECKLFVNSPPGHVPFCRSGDVLISWDRKRCSCYPDTSPVTQRVALKFYTESPRCEFSHYQYLAGCEAPLQRPSQDVEDAREFKSFIHRHDGIALTCNKRAVYSVTYRRGKKTALKNHLCGRLLD